MHIGMNLIPLFTQHIPDGEKGDGPTKGPGVSIPGKNRELESRHARHKSGEMSHPWDKIAKDQGKFADAVKPVVNLLNFIHFKTNDAAVFFDYI